MDEVTQHGDNSPYRQQLIDAYLQRAGSFRKVFTSLLAFTAAFGFFIAWPYLATVYQEQVLSEELASVNAQLDELAAQQQRYAEPSRHIRALGKAIDQGPAMLREYILGLNAGQPFSYPPASTACQALTDPSPSQVMLQLDQLPQPNMAEPMQQLSMQAQTPLAANAVAPRPLQTAPPPDNCDLADPQQRAICRIDRFVQYQLCEYEQLFRTKVLPALALLNDNGTPLFDQAELTTQFEQVRQALRRHITDNPSFWHTIEGKGQMGIRLHAEVDRLWADIARRIDPVIEQLAKHSKAARQRQATLEADAVALQGERKRLTARLDQIESPVGNLPIGLTESVLLFPVVLVIGFGMATGGLLEQVRLRRELQDAEAESAAGGEALDSHQLARVAPLWIEPAAPAVHRLLRWLLLLIPAVVFIGTVVSILASPTDVGLLRHAVVGEWVYPLLYAAGLLGLATCMWLVRQGLHRLG
jgi:hypothetical protein